MFFMALVVKLFGFKVFLRKNHLAHVFHERIYSAVLDEDRHANFHGNGKGVPAELLHDRVYRFDFLPSIAFELQLL